MIQIFYDLDIIGEDIESNLVETAKGQIEFLDSVNELTGICDKEEAEQVRSLYWESFV